MYVVPEAMRARGVALLLHPSALDAPGFDPETALAGLTAGGDLLLHGAGGLFSSGRTELIPAAALRVTKSGSVFEVAGGILRSVVFDLHERSTATKWLDALARGELPKVPDEGYKPLGTVEVHELIVDPLDPRRPPRTRAIGRERSTPWLWRAQDGSLVIDDPHEVLDVPAAQIRAIEPSGSDPLVSVIHWVRPGPEGLVAGLSVRAAQQGLLPTSGSPPLGLLQAPVRGHLEGRPIAGRIVVRNDSEIGIYEASGAQVGAITSVEARWRAEGDTLLVRGPGEQFAVTIAWDVGQWLMRGIPESPVPLYEILEGPVAPGAGELRVDGSTLTVATSSEAQLDLAAIEEPAVRAEIEDGQAVLRIGSLLSVRGTSRSIADLRQKIGPALGTRRLAQLDLPGLYRRYHELRTERWLWLIFGPIFVTGKKLQAAASLPREEDEQDDRLQRRRLVAETLVVSEQVRAFRLRFGAAAAALPYAMLEEEAAWLGAIAGDAAAGSLARHRARIVDGLRIQIRTAASQLAFAQLDIERAVARLEPLHFPELRGQPPSLFGAGTLGKIGLGAAVMLLNPISGGVQIASALAGTVTDRLSKDGTAQVLLDRFGPFCRTSWELLVNVAGVTAGETGAWLHALWAQLALRDRELVAPLPGEGRDAVRSALVARIAGLQRDRQRAVEIEGLTIADVMAEVREAITSGPEDLTKGLGA